MTAKFVCARRKGRVVKCPERAAGRRHWLNAFCRNLISKGFGINSSLRGSTKRSILHDNQCFNLRRFRGNFLSTFHRVKTVPLGLIMTQSANTMQIHILGEGSTGAVTNFHVEGWGKSLFVVGRFNQVLLQQTRDKRKR